MDASYAATNMMGEGRYCSGMLSCREFRVVILEQGKGIGTLVQCSDCDDDVDDCGSAQKLDDEKGYIVQLGKAPRA